MEVKNAGLSALLFVSNIYLKCSLRISTAEVLFFFFNQSKRGKGDEGKMESMKDGERGWDNVAK